MGDANFHHPVGGLYLIEPKGEHHNAQAGLTQVIDDVAGRSMVNRFNLDAQQPGFAGMLVDREHFKHDLTKESRAYGWLFKLENRTDGIYGQIRWTTTGRAAVDGGDYRFFSTEYDPGDFQPVGPVSASPRRVRPLRLAGLTLTNVPNNKGGRPITNRDAPAPVMGRSAFLPSVEVPLTLNRLAEAFGEHVRSVQARDKLDFTVAWNRVTELRPVTMKILRGTPSGTNALAAYEPKAKAAYLAGDQPMSENDYVLSCVGRLKKSMALLAMQFPDEDFNARWERAKTVKYSGLWEYVAAFADEDWIHALGGNAVRYGV